MSAPRQWVDASIDAQAAEQYAESVQSALSRDTYISFLRIPGQQQYLEALDDAVLLALRGQIPANEALAGAAAEWAKITESIGVNAQRKAYRQNVGLEAE